MLKQRTSPPPQLFQLEAQGLEALRVPDGPRIPDILLVGDEFILLQDFGKTPPPAGFWEEFGRRLAAMHRHHSPRFGFANDNYLGVTPQRNPPTVDGYEFFVQHRLQVVVELPDCSRLLERADVAALERLCGRIRDIVPPQPASLIHGDLWRENAIVSPQGEPALIDPAAHYGWAEADMGMTKLFGGFPESFYEAYVEVNPLETGWRKRLDFYNLYHLLNHIAHFGASYVERFRSVLKAYT